MQLDGALTELPNRDNLTLISNCPVLTNKNLNPVCRTLIHFGFVAGAQEFADRQEEPRVRLVGALIDTPNSHILNLDLQLSSPH